MAAAESSSTVDPDLINWPYRRGPVHLARGGAWGRIPIGYDTGELGELAGKCLVKRLPGKPRPRVLLIASREHDLRQQSRAQVPRPAIPDVAITTDDNTNDEMARGAVDALTACGPPANATSVDGVVESLAPVVTWPPER